MRFKRDWIESLEQMVFFEKGGVHKGGQDILLAAESTLFCTHKRDRAAAQHKSILCVSSIDRAYSIVAAAHADTAADRRKRFLCVRVCFVRTYKRYACVAILREPITVTWFPSFFRVCVCHCSKRVASRRKGVVHCLSVPTVSPHRTVLFFFLSRHLRRYSEAIPYWII